MYEWEMNVNQPLNFLAEINKINKYESPIFHIHGSMGDVYIQISLLNEKYKAGEKFSIIIDEKYSEIIKKVFNDKLLILFVNEGIANTHFTKLNLLGKTKYYPIRMLPTVYPLMAELILEGKLNYVDFLRNLTNSNEEGSLKSIESKETYDQSIKYFESLGLPIGKTVILCPDNNTHHQLPSEFWNNIIKMIIKLGLTPSLNDSGSLISNSSEIKNLINIKKIKVPISAIISITKIAGYYICGTNGYSCVQSLFNDSSIGIHLIKESCDRGFVVDKFGNKTKTQYNMHKNIYAKQFLGIQREIIIEEDKSNYKLVEEIKNIFTTNIR
jgi:hypothetical protein